MKSKLVLFCSLMGIASMTAMGQKTGGSSAGGTAAGAAGGTSTSPGTSGTSTSGLQETRAQNSQSLPPGLQNREQLPPGLDRREQLPPGLQRGNVGGAQADGRSESPAGGVTPIGSDTNRIPMTASGTNSALGSQGNPNQRSTATTRRAVQDKAFTAEDQRLLTQVRRQVLPVLRATEATTPVHFMTQNGIVTLVGSVPSIEQKQRIVTMVERTPGVTQVVDQLQVGSQAGGLAGTAQGSFGTNASSVVGATATGTNLTATSQQGSSNRIYSGTNQLTAPGVTPPSDQMLQNRPNQGRQPSGLQNRDLFPASQNREPSTSTNASRAAGNPSTR